MDEMLIHYWNQTVSPDDTVYYLGDFSMDMRLVERITLRLNGTKYLIPGNHDKVFKEVARAVPGKWYEYYTASGWNLLSLTSTICLGDKTNNLEVMLSHLPYYDPHSFDKRYDEYKLKDQGKTLLCGHVHEKWKTLHKMINIGVDQWDYKPVSQDQIEHLLINQLQP
jgi:calcineurin-like phosphoesterase family protein